MQPEKNKLKRVDLKLSQDLSNLEKFHPVRDLDAHLIIDKLEKAHKERTLSIDKRLKVQK